MDITNSKMNWPRGGFSENNLTILPPKPKVCVLVSVVELIGVRYATKGTTMIILLVPVTWWGVWWEWAGAGRVAAGG